MIQFNLLPDIKLTYIKAERQKRLVFAISVVVTIASLAVLIFLLVTVNVVQKVMLNGLRSDMDKTVAQLQEIEDLDKILTVQSQLGSLAGLHEQKVTSSRLYYYLTQVTPGTVSISSVAVDYSQNTLEVTGNAPSLADVNKYVDSYKYTTYSLPDQDPAAAFDGVVLSAFTREEEEASYTVTMNYDAKLFDNKIAPTLGVPNIVTSSPDAKRPTALFKPAAPATDGATGE